MVDFHNLKGNWNPWPFSFRGGGGGGQGVQVKLRNFHCFATNVTSMSCSSETTEGREVKVYIF